MSPLPTRKPRAARIRRKGKRPLTLEPLELRAMLSITATIDYSYDTNSFFDTTAKRDLLQLAADELVGHFGDDLSAIIPSGSDTWSATFFHPATGSSESVSNPSVAADELVIYAGGRDLGGTLGQGGPGGYSVSGSSSWITTVQTRGEAGASAVTKTDFGPWGGSVSFNTTTNWHFGETTEGLESDEFDFYSVALHELAHLLGFGTAASFDTRANFVAHTFDGPASVAQYDGTGDVPLSNTNGHWANGTTDEGQETAMDPSILAGTRKEMTLLDIAALADLGWEIDFSEAAQTHLTASDLAASDWFGYAVDIDGDYAVVTAPLDDDSGLQSGSAYVQFFNGGGWAEQAKITALDGGAVDEFGWSVAISGDTVVVGSWLDDDNGNNAGAAYIFQRDHGGINTWGQVAKITGSDTTAADKFGFSVDIDGDTVIVGAEHDDPSGSASGAAYVFDRHQGGTDNWGEVAKLTGSDSAASDLFGFSVSIDGDYAVVGSRFGDSVVANTGSAFVYGRNQGGTDAWGQIKKLTASDAALSDQFGYSVAVSGTTIAVGARLDDDGASNTGSVYIFDQDHGGANNWGQAAKLNANDATAGAWYGASIDLDGDELAVGTYFAKNGGAAKIGAIYHHSRDQGGAGAWDQIVKLTADDPLNNDRNGYSVGISGTRVISGAYLEDPNGTTSAGSAYIYVIVPGGSGVGTLVAEEPLAEELTGENASSSNSFAADEIELLDDSFARLSKVEHSARSACCCSDCMISFAQLSKVELTAPASRGT